MKNVYVWLVLMVFMFSVTSGAFAAANDEKDNTSDFKQANEKTQQLKEEWNKRTEKKYFKDKDQTEQQFQASITSGFSGRPGVFLITLDTLSSDSSDWAGGHAGIIYPKFPKFITRVILPPMLCRVLPVFW